MLGKAIEIIRKEENIDKASLSLPTDICHISEIVRNLHSEDQAVRLAIVLWLPQILRNPFKLSKLIKNAEVECLKDFLLKYFEKECNRQIRKKIILSIALLASNILRKESAPDLTTALSSVTLSEKCSDQALNGFFRLEDESYYIFNHRVSAIDFYSCLKQLSKLVNVPEKYLTFCSSDSIIIKRYKIKIISHNPASGLEELKMLISHLNFDDSKFGWTLSKAIYRMKRTVNRKTFIFDLQEMISGQTFGDEQLWINVMTILSFFLLDGEQIGDIKFLNQALLFNSEFNTKAKYLRETALFLCWCLTRREYGLENAIHIVIFVALFDSDLTCRRAAASIVQEFVGRNQQTEGFSNLLHFNKAECTCDYSSLRNIVQEYKDSKTESPDFCEIPIFENILPAEDFASLKDGILLINPESIKRPLNCLIIFYFIKNKGIFKDLIYNMLWSYNRITRIQASFIISNFYNVFEIASDYSTVYKIDGTNLLISKALSFLRPSLTLYSSVLLSELRFTPNALLLKILDTKFTDLDYSIGRISDHFNLPLSNFVLTPQFYSLRNSKDAVASYLELYDIVDPGIFKTNLLFLITKGFFPELILSAISRICFKEDPDFSQKVFKTISRNETGLLVNTQNLIYRQQAIAKYKNNVFNGAWVNQSIRALAEMEYFEDEIFEKIASLLEDYSVGYDGDVGYFNRSESMKYVLKMKIFKSELPNEFIIENYMIRFLSDKSRKLREDVLKILLRKFPRFASNFRYLVCLADANDLKEDFVIDRRYEDRFESFFITHAKLCNDYKSDQAYFKSLFDAFSEGSSPIYCSNYFYRGIINTLDTADDHLKEILLDLVEPLKRTFINECLDIINENKHFVLPALKFLYIFKDDERTKFHMLKLGEERFKQQEKIVYRAILDSCRFGCPEK